MRRPVRRFDGLESLRPDLFRRPVATLGVFDGVHRGHGEVLARTAALAARLDGEPVAVTFDRHPQEVVAGRDPGTLSSLEHRVRLLARAGMAAVVVLRFDERLREIPAERFLEEVLVSRVGIAGLVLGPDSHFGKARGGNPDLARRVLDPLGIPVESVPPVLLGGRPVSSTAIRAAIRAGDLAAAEGMLGRPVAVLGRVVRGEGRGRSLGFPTANLDLAHEIRPPRGVYAGRVLLPDGEAVPALVNIGGRPTFHPEGEGEDTVEAWLLDWEGDLYGADLEVSFLVRLRDERRFEGPEALRRQIEADRDALREMLRRESLGAGGRGG